MAAAALLLALLFTVAVAARPAGSHCANHSAGCWFHRAGKNCSAAHRSVETEACMAGQCGPGGGSAEAGRSSGQPEVCSGAGSSLWRADMLAEA